jgi:hypothetical protein
MKKATIFSACECQAKLGAELDEQKAVMHGWASLRRQRHERAPAHSISPERSRFEVAWLCPFCTRNTLRVFETSGLVFRENGAPAAKP